MSIILDESQVKFLENQRRKKAYFNECYSLEKLIILQKEKQFVGDRLLKKCRFCLKKTPEIKIKGTAHIAPEALGFRNIFSWVECHDCNTLRFDRFDTELVDFIGPFRALWSSKGKRGYPGFLNPKTGFKIERNGNEIRMFSKQEGDPELEIDREKMTGATRLTKTPYIPVLVFKSLIKTALSIVDESEYSNFEETRRWLMSVDNVKWKQWDFKIHFYHVDPPIKFNPGIALFNRKVVELTGKKVFEKCIVMCFGRVQLQYTIPFSKQDTRLAKTLGKKWTVPIHPLIRKETDPLTKFWEEERTFNSWDKVDNEIQILSGNIEKITPSTKI